MTTPANERARPEQVWWQLLLLLLVIVSVLGWIVRTRKAIAEQRANLEVAGFNLDDDNDQPSWHVWLFGLDPAYLKNIGTETNVDDDNLLQLSGLYSLESLDLSRSKVTDRGLANLQGLLRLERLDLRLTNVTPAGLDQLGNLPRLQHLYVGREFTTEEGLRHLRRLPHLNSLDFTCEIMGLRYDACEIDRVGNALPGVEVYPSGGGFF